MALVVKDRVQETTTTVGTGTLTLNGAVLGFQTFAVIGNANQTYYAIADPTTGDYEVGIGTYTASGTTLSRTTVLESSNSNSLVSFAAGVKNVFCTYPAERAVYLDTAGSAVTLLDIGTLGVSIANITTANITSGTVSTTPTNNTDIVNKQYADAIASGIHFHEAVALATTAALPANTYNNGTSGVGATLTGNANGALSVDSTLTIVAERILVKNEAAGANNGVYTVTQVGSAGTPYILTRATDFDTVGTGVDQIDEGDFFLVTSGTANVNTAWVQQTAPPITIGTTAIVFQQFSAPITYTAGTGLSESPSYTFNIANTGTAGTYGGAASVPVFTTNAQGQVTSVTNTGIAIASGAVSGLAASATTDTTDANNITSGTLGTSRLSGSYTGVTGVGTLTAGTWNATPIGAVYGGTGQSSYAVGDLVYADTTTSLAKLADVAVGNALISGGVGAAPSYGKIGLATHVSGTLPIANGGTGSTATTFVDLATNVSGTLPVANGGTGAATFTANNVLLGNGTSALQVVAPGTNGNVLQSNGTTWVSAAAPSSQVYPGVGIANSTGTSWGTSYSTSGSGTVVALTTSPSFTTPELGTPSSGNLANCTFPTLNQNTTGSAGSVANALTAGSFLTSGGTFNGSAARTFAVDATNLNTASKVVARDASGNFSAGTITATLSGAASSATNATFASSATNATFASSAGSITSQANSATITASTAATANQIVLRDGSGDDFRRYGFGSYFNSSDDVSGGTISYVMAKFGDNYYRSATAAKVASFISGQSMNISGSATNAGFANNATFASSSTNASFASSSTNATLATLATLATTAGKLSTAGGSAPSYSARAWVNFFGQGSISVRASGNISSVSRNAVGNYTINFSTGMQDVNYATVGSAWYPGGQQAVFSGNSGGTYSTSAVQVYVVNSANGVTLDTPVVNVSIFR